jgi:serine protease Do
MTRALSCCTLLWLLAGGPASPPAAATQQAPAAGDARVTPVVRVVRDVGPAVVNVFQDVPEVELPSPYDRILGRTKRSSLGSGVLIDPEGYVLTNAHVIPLGSEGIRVSLAGGEQYPAKLVSVDNENDVALLRIRPREGHDLVAARLGTSSDLMVGETIIAIGNPLGRENSVSTGIVSSLYRDVRVGRQQVAEQPAFKDFIQIDAPINRGNSGGPLLNVHGEVIGINFAMVNEAQGIGFAIPIDRVRRSLTENLLNPRLRREVVTGFEVQGGATGRDVVLADLAPDGPAAQAGLREGDRLVSLHGTPIAWEFDYSKALLGSRPGDRIPVVVRRGDETIRTELVLARDESPFLCIWRRLGLEVVDDARYKGVRVQSVDAIGPGAALGLAEGDLIDGIGDGYVDDAVDVYRALVALAPGTTVRVHVWRQDVAAWGRLTTR